MNSLKWTPIHHIWEGHKRTFLKKKKFVFLKKLRSQDICPVLLEFTHKQNSHMTPFLVCVLTMILSEY